MTWIETGRELSKSKLEERLEAYRDPETKHILLTQEQAKDELLRSLLSFYKARVGRPAPIVEALVQIAEKGEKERFDFTEALEKFENKQADIDREVRERTRVVSMISPATPPDREI
ncbi:MAG: hypothetical protein ABIJ85_01510 [bacterium]